MAGSDWFQKFDISAVVLPNDKLAECHFFYELAAQETERDKFRWYLSAFLGACYSYLEIKALQLHHQSSDPETGDTWPDEEALSVLREHVRTLQNKKNSSYVKTSAVSEIMQQLYEARKENIHHNSLAIMIGGKSLPEDFHLGMERGKGKPALDFCRQVLQTFETIETELQSI